MFNPKLKKFLEENPEQTILGFAWSCYWRIYVIVFVVAFAIAILCAIGS